MNLNSDRDAARFLDRATFGVRRAELQELRNIGVEAWLKVQRELPPSYQFPLLKHKRDQVRNGNFWHYQRVGAWYDTVLWGKDQLRQRMAFALSQLVVVSIKDDGLSGSGKDGGKWGQRLHGVVNYYDMLIENALGNYRDILNHVSRSPIMGTFLTHMGNRSFAASGSHPDQNYARELMQLFSIGLNELELNGTVRLDSEGIPIENYSVEDVENVAKIMTGWQKNNDMLKPMKLNESVHDQGEKRVLGHYFPPGVGAEEELNQLLDILIAHPSTAPYISKFFISKLVTSNPKPDYVERVARVFRDTQGDLFEMAKAILLDPNAYHENPLHLAKVREPILYFTGYLRILDVRTSTSLGFTYTDGNIKSSINQVPMAAPSVFNFFESDYSPQGPVADNELIAPELDGYDWTLFLGSENQVHRQLWSFDDKNFGSRSDRFYISIADYVDIAADSVSLIDLITQRVLNGKISDALYQALVEITDSYNGNNAREIARQALYMSLTSPEYRVQE
ncbi:DUF1800 domain-containing protein [Vibrio maritimus]|uniref:DUF1800 domain-containing protein n=1 Tax=Vibrio maritimus TaxID=990268 RepID=UPI001F1BBFA2|nr:DUF1800 family protein [Vibrio maritimus]